jgi:hypothetical protein
MMTYTKAFNDSLLLQTQRECAQNLNLTRKFKKYLEELHLLSHFGLITPPMTNFADYKIIIL